MFTLKYLYNRWRYPSLSSITSKFQKTFTKLEKRVDSHNTRIINHNISIDRKIQAVKALDAEMSKGHTVIANLKTLLGESN